MRMVRRRGMERMDGNEEDVRIRMRKRRGIKERYKEEEKNEGNGERKRRVHYCNK